jgi:4-amino-4-deoxy-L-arabinose transferase-like glycosyltransferase
LAHSHVFLLSWIGVFLVFFSLAATKLPNYIVPCYPALALLTGWWIVGAVRSAAESRFWLRIGLTSYAVVGLLLTIGLAITASIYLDGDGLVAVTGLAPLVGGIVAVVLLRRESARPAMAAFAISGVLFTVCATSVTAPRVSPYQTSPLVAEQFNQIRKLLGDDATEFGTYHYTKPNIVFYFGRPVPTLGSDEQAAAFFAEHPGGYLAMPATDYQRLAPQLPAELAVVHTEPKFMKPSEEVVVVGRPAQLARRTTADSKMQ